MHFPITQILPLIGLTLFACSVGQAQEDRPDPRPDFPFDGDDNRFPPELIDRFDEDGNGELSDSERARIREEMERRFRDSGPGRGGPRGRGPGREEQVLVPRFEINGDGILDAGERLKAREWVKANNDSGDRGRGRRGGGRWRGFGGDAPEATPGAQVAIDEVEYYPHADLYDPSVLRTLFLQFDGGDWEKELEDFSRTDVEVPAKLTVDGKALESDIGVSFRGNSSYFTVGSGKKRSMNLVIDAIDDDQRLYGYKTLNLINSHADPSFIREALFSHIAGQYIPTPKVNFVKLVINGENWGIYVNAQQFNKDFLDDWFDTREGVRWKVPASPGGGAGLVYQGDDVETYKRSYQIKTSGDENAAYQRLIHLFKVLDETPAEALEENLRPILNIDNALWFLAVDNVLQDGDGYFSRGSDFAMYEDPSGRFHFIHHDNNESFQGTGGGGPGFNRGGPRGRRGFGGPRFGPPGAGERESERGGVRDRVRGRSGNLDGAGVDLPFGQSPLVGIDDERTPLVQKLLAVPALKARYIAHVRTLVEDQLNWEKIEPVANAFRDLIREEIVEDTKKLSTTEAFEESLSGQTDGGRRSTPSLKMFVGERETFLLNHPELQKPYPKLTSLTRIETAKAGEAIPINVLTHGETKAETVLLHYATESRAIFESIKMHSAEDQFRAEIPGQPMGTRVYFYAESRSAGDETASFLPSRAEAGAASYQVSLEITGSSPVVINELMASNQETLKDPHGDYDDWIELYNASDDVVVLKGFSLTDNEANLRKWTFPDDATIAPRGFLVIWADEDGKQKKGYHANFKLSKYGETIILSNAQGEVVDKIAFGKLDSAEAFGRETDGGEKWLGKSPTPAKSNS